MINQFENDIEKRNTLRGRLYNTISNMDNLELEKTCRMFGVNVAPKIKK
jgi:hypothetical protein